VLFKNKKNPDKKTKHPITNVTFFITIFMFTPFYYLLNKTTIESTTLPILLFLA